MTWKIRSIKQIDIDTATGNKAYAYYVRMCCNGTRPQLISEYAITKDPNIPNLHKVEKYATEVEAQAIIDSMPSPYNTILVAVEE